MRAFVSAASAFVSVTLLIASPMPASAQTWQHEEETSALDGKKKVWENITSSNQPADVLGRPSVGLLSLRCMDGWISVSVRIAHGNFGYSSNGTTVRWKVDDGAIQKETWGTPGGNTDTIMNTGRSMKKILDALHDGHKFIIVVSGYHGDQEVVFDLGSAGPAVDSVRAACNKRP